MDGYLTGLAAIDIVIGDIRRSMSERRGAVDRFLRDHWYKELNGSIMLRPTYQSSHAQSPERSTYIDYESDVQPGDYGVFVPGQQEELSFQACGNVVDDSSGIISTAPSRSWIYNYINQTFPDEVQDSPRM